MSPQNTQRCLTMFLLTSLAETLSSSLEILLPKLIINIIVDFHQESIQSAFWNRKILIYPHIFITDIFCYQFTVDWNNFISTSWTEVIITQTNVTDWFYKVITAIYFIWNRTLLYVSGLIRYIPVCSILPAVLKTPFQTDYKTI